MLLQALALALAYASAQSQVAPAPPQVAGVSYVILGDDVRRARLQRLLDAIPDSGEIRAVIADDAMNFVGCVSAWRSNKAQAVGCIQSRLPHVRPTVVLNTYPQPVRNGEISVSCIGSGGSAAITLQPQPDPGEATALRRCLDAAFAAASPTPPRRYGLQSIERLEVPDVHRARASAVRVLTMAVDHVGVPRGSEGVCSVSGRVARMIRGPGLPTNDRFSLGVPCAAVPDRTETRVAMSHIFRGSFANVYVSEQDTLLDYELVSWRPSQTGAAAPDPGRCEAVGTPVTIYFDRDSTNITPQAAASLDGLILALLRTRFDRLEVIGHTDRSSPETISVPLSHRIADSVAFYLANRGIPSSQLVKVGAGSSRPAIESHRGVREPRNQRAEIQVCLRP